MVEMHIGQDITMHWDFLHGSVLPRQSNTYPITLWARYICASRGCGKSEHETSTAKGQERINPHFQVHAKRHRSWARYASAFRRCGKKEHEASTAEGQEKINSHFQLHAEQAQELIVDKIPLCNETLGHGNNSQSENEHQQDYHAPGSKRASAAKSFQTTKISRREHQHRRHH